MYTVCLVDDEELAFDGRNWTKMMDGLNDIGVDYLAML
jgi:hypothetical protein